MRADAAGATHAFAAALRECTIRFSLGYTVTETVGAATLALPRSAWRPTLDADGHERDGAWISELTGQTTGRVGLTARGWSVSWAW